MEVYNLKNLDKLLVVNSDFHTLKNIKEFYFSLKYSRSSITLIWDFSLIFEEDWIL